MIDIGTPTEHAYARLQALRENLPDKGKVGERLLREMNDALDSLADLGYEVSAFRITDSDLSPRLSSENPRTGKKHYSEERFIDSILMRTKLDGLLLLFQIKASGTKIGFAPSE